METMTTRELTWKKRGEHGQEAWLEGERGPGHVQGYVFDLFGQWRYWVGCDNADRTLTASMEESGWFADTEEEAKRLCVLEMQRLRQWANGQGPEHVEPLQWRANPHGGGWFALAGPVNVGLHEEAPKCWGVALDATVGEPEEKGYLRAVPVHPSDPMCLGWFEFPTEAEAKAWAQEKAAALCRWLGGEPDASEAIHAPAEVVP